MSQQNVAIVRKLYDRLGRGDYAVAELVDTDLVYARHGTSLGGVLEGEWQGFEEIWAALLEYLRSCEGLRNELERIVDLDDDRVLVLERQVGRGRASGAAVERPMASILAFRDGRITRWDSYYERADALRAAGLQK